MRESGMEVAVHARYGSTQPPEKIDSTCNVTQQQNGQSGMALHCVLNRALALCV